MGQHLKSARQGITKGGGGGGYASLDLTVCVFNIHRQEYQFQILNGENIWRTYLSLCLQKLSALPGRLSQSLDLAAL